MPRTSTPRVWSFAGCVLDERSLELKVSGQIADLDRKPLEVLLHLLRHAGEVVTKDELAEAVWPGRIITDSNLTKTMAVLRAALGDTDAAAIKTVHGYGYRLMAPVSVQAVASEPALARFDFKPGENPPLRPQWQLSSRLGTGGHGEVWLAHHARTKEPRVFKFAEAGGALTGLKREVTLYRLLRETLPDRDSYLRLLDWNFEEPPFFVESDYASGGNLQAWAEARGGLAKIPLAARLELLAQAAEALAAAHSVGVLHKDLKPANILIVEKDGKPRARLADFGSGGVLDPGALEALGITRMGFTQTVHVDGTTSGTPLYLAPEVIAGQPFTVQSDIYALGVMLYQLAAADTRKALAPGWEKDIADELLREDIAQTAAGDPADRLGDAALLAQRLRTLDQRRQQRELDRVQQSQTERVRRMRRELKRLRAVGVVLLLLTAAATTAGVLAFKARNEARLAVETTQAVNQFLNKDLLAGADPRHGATRNLTVRQLLDRAAETVDERFGAQPEIEAQVRVTLGEAYLQLGKPDLAHAHLDKAIAIYAGLHGPTALKTLDARALLPAVLYALGRVEDACALTRELQAQFDRQLDADDDRRLGIRAASSRCLLSLGTIEKAIPEISAVVAELEQREMTDSPWYSSALEKLADAYFYQLNFAEAERQYRKLVGTNARTLGAHHIVTARRRVDLAGTLLNLGRVSEAERELDQAIADHRNWGGEGFEDVGNLIAWLAVLRMEQGRFADAESAVARCLSGPFGQAQRVGVLTILSESLLMQGRLDEAIKSAEETISISREQGRAKQWFELPSRAHWADALRLQGKVADAWVVLDAITADDLAALPAHNAFYALFRRSQGLLWMKQGKVQQARAALQESQESYEFRFGPDHWRTKRAIEELSQVPSP